MGEAGREVSANWFAYQCPDADIRLVLKPPGSHAFLAEYRISAAKAVLTRMQLQYPDTPSEYLFHLITRR